VSLARRYAKALLEIAEKTASVEETAARLDDIALALRENPELDEILKSSMFPRERRRAILRQVAAASEAPEHLLLFLEFLFDRDRLLILPDLARVFRRLADERMGILRGELVSASALSAEQVQRLQEALSRATGRNIIVTSREDPALIGGAMARVGDVIFDGSVRAQLRQIRSSLIGE
jgi:F-type H+-transporting ATPase subunit delta